MGPEERVTRRPNGAKSKGGGGVSAAPARTCSRRHGRGATSSRRYFTVIFCVDVYASQYQSSPG